MNYLEYSDVEFPKQFKTIDSAIKCFIKYNIKINLVDFIKFTQVNFYKNIDISFMDYSLKICQRGDEFCVDPIKEFVNLGVKDKEIESSKLLRTLKSSKLIEDEDYSLLASAGEQSETSRGIKYKNIYLLKPKSFKKLLLDINDHKQRIKFRDYYILLESNLVYNAFIIN